jgi:integrase
MNFVEPIRDRKKIAQIKNQLRGQRRYRDLLLFVVGINTALRISDLLELKVEHFLDDHHHIKRRFWIKEQKQGKRQEVVVNASIKEAFEEYLAAYPEIIGDQKSFPSLYLQRQPLLRGSVQNHEIPPRLPGPLWQSVGSPGVPPRSIWLSTPCWLRRGLTCDRRSPR